MMMALPANSALPGSPVSRWKLGEQSGTRVDSIASNDLTDNNTVTGQTNVQFGEDASDFEIDNSEYLSITDAAQSGLDFTGSMSGSAWFNTENASAYNIVFSKFEAGASGDRAYVFRYDGTGAGLEFYFSTDGDSSDHYEFVNWTATAGQWYLIGFTYNSSTGDTIFYVDGEQYGATQAGTANSPFNAASEFWIGREGTRYMDGLLQDVIVWGEVLSAAQVAQLYNAYDKALPENSSLPQSGSIAGRWKLDEVSGTRADSVGSSTLSDNNTVTAEASQFNKLVADFELDNSEYLSISDNAALSITGDLAGFLWINIEDVSVYNIFFSKFDASDRSYCFRFDGTGAGLEFFFSTDGSNTDGYEFVNWSPTAGAWYHVGVVYDASAGEVKFYVNGVQYGATQTGTPTSIYDGGADFRVGRESTRYLDGLMQDLIIWDGAELTDAEVEDLYNAYFNLPDEADFPQSGSIVGRWTLTEDGGTRSDQVGTNHLTDNNTVLVGAGIGEDNAVAERAADFELSNTEYLSIADNAALSITGDMSYFCWVKHETTSAGDWNFMGKITSSGNQRAYSFAMTDNGDTIRYDNYSNGTSGSVKTVSESWSPADATWYHVGFVYDASAGSCEFFIDGASLATAGTGLNTSVDDGTSPFNIGANGSGGNPIDAIIQDAIMWDGVVLTAAEVTTLYELYTEEAATGVPSGLTLLGVGI